MLVPQSLSLCNIFGVRCALPPSPVAVPRTVYGNDDRRDWYELDYTSAGDAMAGRLLANSIMVHITRADLGAPDSHGIYRILDDYADSLRLGPVRNMCDGQKFLRQPRLGYCSATLVSPTGVITAGHCVPDQKTCDSAAYVFNYYVTGHDAHGDPTFPLITSDDVYFCKSVSTMYATGGTDIAHITLDRPVLGRVPATYRKTLVPTTPGQKLMMIGFPDGMPAKVEAGGTVTDAGRSNGFEFFVASTDSFGGNSGSGIFDADGMMIGVLVRGIKGYVQSGGCTVVYALPGPRGQEEITYVDRAVSLVSASSGHLPATECTDSCVHSNDGECDDGGHGALYSACDHGSDCADCGHRFPSAPPSASPPPAATTSAPPSECTDSCFHARDGECDDGGNGALYSACDHGTDCMDCGERPHASPPPLTPASPSAASGLPASECTDSCVHSNDGECEDGGHGALYSACDHGSDCVDCGHRFPTSGGTPSIFTGPSGDHTTGSGYYLYTEASGIHSKVHRLESPHFSLQQDATLSFYYHMHDDTGLNMGTLSVEAFERANGWLTLWSQSGHQADSWLHKTVVLPASTIQVRFSGLTGPGFSSDMALDDVSFGQFEPRPVTVSITQSNWFQIGIASRNFARDGDTSTSCPEDSCTTESTTAEFAMFYNHRDNRHNGRLVEGNGIQGQNRVNWGDLPANGARDITVTADCTAKTVTISSDGQSFTGSYPSSWSSVYVAVGAQGGPFSATLPSGNTWLGGSSTQTLSGGFRGNRGEQDLCASSGSASEQNSYSTTTGFCRGGSSWPDGNEYNCFEDVARTRIQMTDAECRQECDANVECAAYDRSWYDRQGILIEDIPTGLTCYHYSLSYCANGVVVPGREFSQGAGFNFPESNCCACGKAFRIVARSPAAA
ncbi:hypothetical protein EMIHUDRAFT_240834 [Emiliania huxleyi CCMP1516]|uniref:Serine protease n=2 Tax=Emiliania huxleyi TaxID=2903 RepID=A0A0D3JEC5_EMIH1|nr:hypothetical protein EMIHUDRAFT_240834 [Emiliania huxleyi CCMP1516]EOD21860.1 hypothetical protein EMIHUDRAFT_240834 [Emiliania huxleyi CCMP1516]|eukprot:XP_005774289.1 hypothetical protein EMIHUDRAFT_240834 [Emiliania huxleyi CCMP1516]